MQTLASLLPLIVMIAIFYFMIIKPQKKQQEEKQNMLSAMAPGDEVVTIGGMYAVVDEILKEENKIVLDCEGVYLTFNINAISSVVNKAGEETTEVENEEVKELETDTSESDSDSKD